MTAADPGTCLESVRGYSITALGFYSARCGSQRDELSNGKNTFLGHYKHVTWRLGPDETCHNAHRL